MDEKEAFLNTVMEANNREILKAWNEERNQIWKEEMTLKSSYKRGIDEGKEEGREEGLQEGIEYNMVSMIKNMLNEKASYDFISKVSGKSIEEIKEIENTMRGE